jgi:CubicO group peptidase (beta-lactamase class C family)
MPLTLTLASFNPRSNLRRAMLGTGMANDDERIYARELEVPSGGGVGTARAIAHAYSVFVTGGHELGLRAETLEALKAPAIAALPTCPQPPKYGFRDECLKGEVQFSLGFMKPSAVWPFGSPAAFGSPGAGGSLGFADPEKGIGYAYVPNRMRMKITGDPREVALRSAVATSLRR